MNASRTEPVPRPTKSTEYTIVFASRQAASGWKDVLASQKNAVVDAWELLTTDPIGESRTRHQLKGTLGTLVHNGTIHRRYQYELNGGARIWYFVVDRTVHLENVHTRHPNQTK